MRNIYFGFIIILFTTKLFSQTKSELKAYFDLNKSEISQKSKTLLDSLVTIAQKDSIIFIEIEGFTDEKGSIENNLLLSEKRAKKVNDYLVEKKYNQKHLQYSGKGIYEKSTIDSLQRNTTLKIKLIRNLILPNYPPVIYEMTSPYITNYREYSSTEDMIKYKMFAIDTSGNIIKTAGMISFNANSEYIKRNNSIEKHFLKTCIPLRNGESYDKEMKVWINKPNSNGEVRWIEKNYEITFDSINKCYSILIECGDLGAFNKINIDKKIPSTDEIVYFSTFRNIKFYDVEIPKATFSAVVSEEKSNLYAFVNNKRNNSDDLVFKGKFTENGKDKVLTVDLKKCKKFKYKGCKHYYLTKKTNYFIDENGYHHQT